MPKSRIKIIIVAVFAVVFTFVGLWALSTSATTMFPTSSNFFQLDPFPPHHVRQLHYLPNGNVAYATKTILTYDNTEQRNYPLMWLVGYINNRGQVTFGKKLWSNGNYSYLQGSPSRDGIIAKGINDKGQIVGDGYVNGDDGNNLRAFLWDNGRLKDLGTLRGANKRYDSEVYDINNKGHVVGVSDCPTVDRFGCAFLWKSGRMKELKRLDPSYVWHFAIAINDSDQIVGYASDSDGNSKAVLWQNGTIRDLGTVGKGVAYQAKDINNRGQIIGSYKEKSDLNGNDSSPRVFLWENGVMRDLGMEAYAMSINNKGQIAVRENCQYSGECDFIWQNGERIYLNDLLSEDNWLDGGQELRINDNGQITAGNILIELPK